jgi:hypothetical protein
MTTTPSFKSNNSKWRPIILLIVIMIASDAVGQTYIKGNAMSTLLGLPGIGIEKGIGEYATIQFDVMGSPWRSIQNKPKQFVVAIFEYRHHFKAKFNGFYVGANMGGTAFNIQKWNYINSDQYQKGFGFVVGATIGYKAPINEKFVLDCFVGGGSHQGFYKGYYISTGERYDGAKNYNKSGEWFPYRAGVMVSYKLF